MTSMWNTENRLHKEACWDSGRPRHLDIVLFDIQINILPTEYRLLTQQNVNDLGLTFQVYTMSNATAPLDSRI